MRAKSVLTVLGLLSVVVIACTSTARDHPFRYNYLNSEGIRDFVAQELETAGFLHADVQAWIAQIDRYNAICEPFVKSTESGWVTVNLRDYAAIDFGQTIDFWYEDAVREASDANCRTSLFLLIESGIESGEQNTASLTGNLVSEIQYMEGQEYYGLDEEAERDYTNLFGDMPIDSSGNGSDIAGRIQREWESRAITYWDNDVKLIRVVGIPVSANLASVLHAGLTFREGEHLYFVEKKNPLYPFQISEFTNREDFRDYLGMVFAEAEGTVLVFENSVLLFELK